MSLVLPSLSATASTVASTFFSAALVSSVAPSSASLTAAMRAPDQVLKSFGELGAHDLFDVGVQAPGLDVLELTFVVEVLEDLVAGQGGALLDFTS